MSLVGTRPILQDELQKYELHHRARIAIKPGIKLLDDPVRILRIIFGNKCFNTGRIKDGHIRFCRVDRLTDRLGNINKVIENKLEVI